MVLKDAYMCAALLLPLAGFVWYITGAMNLKFRPVFRASSLTSARDKDSKITKLINKGKENISTHLGPTNRILNAYLPPIMCISYKSRHHGSHSSISSIDKSNKSIQSKLSINDNNVSYQNL